ncbi:MAG: hypothetical protein IPO36_12430 [Anaerolineales bacterium]|jgi:hypothetical protein|nr:hypothetical protein [Anaerolineales bacterium]
MKTNPDLVRTILYRLGTILIIVFILISCEPFTSAPGTDAQSISSTDTALAQTSERTQVPPRTPPALPAVFQSAHLNPLDTPHTYIEDACQYLHNKWNPLSAEPGTVVMIVMFNDILMEDFDRIMEQLHEQGFQAINTKELLAFMERNVKIPQRSVVIIQNDSQQADDLTRNYREYYDRWKWVVVNGWVSNPDAPEYLWQDNIALENEGWVDHQAQGMIPGTVLSDDSSKTVIQRELENPITAFVKLYNKNPIAIIWPGGGFGMRPVEAARQLGYQLGFTANARGPVMYNWVPLANEVDPERPTYIPEGQINDPLMTLPRYWPDQILNAIDAVRVTGNEASAYAKANKEVELEYYDIVCADTYGPMPTP